MQFFIYTNFLRSNVSKHKRNTNNVKTFGKRKKASYLCNVLEKQTNNGQGLGHGAGFVPAHTF